MPEQGCILGACSEQPPCDSGTACVAAHEWCFSHARREPIPEGGAYRICGECWHCYVTADDLIREVAKVAAEMNLTPTTDPDLVFFCPLCAHDF